MKIEDYGLIGDMQSAALIGKNGSVDWLCFPRFDSHACFASLLGTEENGFWKIAPKGEIKRARQQYREGSLILETIFETAEGSVRVVDAMAINPKSRSLVRCIEPISGRVEMEMKFTLRLDYGRTIPWVQAHGRGILAIAGPDALLLRSEVEMRGEGLSTVANFVSGETERESEVFVLSWFRSHEATPEPVDGRRLLQHAEAFWREWSLQCKFTGKWRNELVRSLITLKALTFGPTGGIVAAATTSLPEKIGGVRNWDYRFCWLRDATFTLYSMMQSGYTNEASAWIQWLLRAVAGDAAQLQIMYGAAGERMLTEVELTHLSGYENSKPVRIGNAASEQFQLDVYGEVIDAMHLARKMNITIGDAGWRLERHLVEFVIENWEKPDEGIWEVRGPRQHFTHSKVMAWVALDRAVKAIEHFDLEGDLERWKEARAKIHETVCRECYSEKRGSFVQAYGSDRLDASTLMIPLVGFLPPTDERVIRTVDTIRRELSRDGFLLRYKTEGEVDGLPPGEGVFLPCSFWLVDCLQLIGRHDEAEKLLERLLSLQSPLGMFAEEYDPQAKRFVGNFPQAFTHVSVVNSIQNLASAHARSSQVRSDGPHGARTAERSEKLKESPTKTNPTVEQRSKP
ncbi:MAG TPA: glycoside hydrolase family 15 protein [Opitutaceae bacterium]|nr:glycoside hydrolase family 15 protein [Opitutaceae bacterium]